MVTTPDAGDTDDIIRRDRVGVLVDGEDEGAHVRALDRLDTLLAEEGLAKRCRQAAERYYDLETGCSGLRRLYDSLVSGNTRVLFEAT